MSRYTPKLLVCLREGYTRSHLFNDLAAGITVGIIALPLAMAFGIASIPESAVEGARAMGHEISPPAMGLYTAIVAGALISLLGGSRVQIGGPTGAFIVIVYGIAAQHGYAGLATATLMAGVAIIIMGLARLGAVIKFIPYPVTTGFTSGIAIIIFSSQIKDFFGLRMGSVPAEFIDKWGAYAEAAPTWSPQAFGVALASLVVLAVLRKAAPRLPGAVLVVIAASLVVWLAGLPVETIGSRFGSIPRTLPAPSLPPLSFSLAMDLVPEAATIAILAAIESLLSAVVADGMIGGRHKADCELVAQGIANIASIIFGGIPATGAIARTTANIKSGARTPVAGIIHAVTLVGIMALAAPLAGRIPLPALAAVLMMVAWNMSEREHFRALLRAPRSDVAVLLVTFFLTVFADLTVAVGMGMVLASLLFMRRMADLSDVRAISAEFAPTPEEIGELEEANSLQKREIPEGVEAFQISGPFFFGVAHRLKDALERVASPPRVFILRLRKVPVIDATGLHALEEFHDRCRRHGTVLVLSGVQPEPLRVFRKVEFDVKVGRENIAENIDRALERAREILGGSRPSTTPSPPVAAETR